jgi:hypothetical protein
MTSLSDLDLTNPTGYFVEDLWTSTKYGLMQPDDIFKADVAPTGVVMLKATIAQAFNGYPFDNLTADKAKKNRQIDIELV